MFGFDAVRVAARIAMIDPTLTEQAIASPTVSDLLNEAPRSKFHHRAVVISGAGFFTDAYDLFVISTVAALVTKQWSLSTTQKHFYNRTRRHSSLGMISPIAYEKLYTERTSAA
ncbi:MAG: hypothetical protein ABSC73_07640 [Acidimicrobiales bacterium]